MVYGVEELENKIKQVDTSKIRALEECIDKTLEEKFDGREVTINLSSVELPRKNLLDNLLGEYRRAGWCVSHHSSQFDGSYLSFEPKAKSKLYSSSSSLASQIEGVENSKNWGPYS